MQIKQNGIVLVLPVNIDPLLCAVDINIHRFIDAAFRRSVVDFLPDEPDNEEQDNDGNQDNEYPFYDLKEIFEKLFHYMLRSASGPAV